MMGCPLFNVTAGFCVAKIRNTVSARVTVWVLVILIMWSAKKFHEFYKLYLRGFATS